MPKSDTPQHKTPLFGAIITGFLASSCCLGPLLVVSFGLGSASLFISFEPYRPLFASITLALLGWVAWKYWQGRRQCVAEKYKSARPVLLWVLGGMALLLLVSPTLLSWLMP